MVARVAVSAVVVVIVFVVVAVGSFSSGGSAKLFQSVFFSPAVK